MTTVAEDTYYRGEFFRTVLEARWAVFFQVHEEFWSYEPDGHPDASAASYRPQFFLPARGVYLEVRERWDRHARHPYGRHHPEAPEPLIFLAAGDVPTDQQMRAVGWWDSETRHGVQQLTAGLGIDWDTMFPPTSDDVLAALEAARDQIFDLFPHQRTESGPLRNIQTECEPEDDDR